jgi:O-antigen chain-terminating methyltransferase
VADWLEGSDEEFLERAWRLALRREPDPDGRREGLARLHEGRSSRAAYLAELLEGEPFAHVRALDDALAFVRRESGRPRELHAPAGADERAVEIPWVLSRYAGERRVLDVGTVFAEPAYVAGLHELGIPDLVTVDLAAGATVVADVRDLPFESGRFDLVLCVSTLEHVGRDNAVYDVDAPQDEHGDEAALRELRRVLAPDGRLLVTVPTGVDDDQGWQVQRAPLAWVERFERAGFLVFEDELYVRDADGWRTATLAEAAGAHYGKAGAGAVLLAELRPTRLGERVRLAVRDVRHRDVARRSTTMHA